MLLLRFLAATINRKNNKMAVFLFLAVPGLNKMAVGDGRVLFSSSFLSYIDDAATPGGKYMKENV